MKSWDQLTKNEPEQESGLCVEDYLFDIVLWSWACELTYLFPVFLSGRKVKAAEVKY